MRFILVGIVLGIMLMASSGSSVNCMWDQSCEEEKYNIDFCGNGICDPFENTDTCNQDCGTMFDSVRKKFISFFGLDKEGESRGIFGSIGDSSMSLMVQFFFGIIASVVIAVILIALYNRIVETIERES